MTGQAGPTSVRTAIGRSLLALSAALALVTVVEFYGLLTAGWIIFRTWYAMLYAMLWLACQMEFSVMAAIRVGRRPLRGSLMLAGSVLSSLPLVAWLGWLPHRGAVAAWLVGAAALVVAAGVIGQRLPEPGPRRRTALRMALDELRRGA